MSVPRTWSMVGLILQFDKDQSPPDHIVAHDMKS
jgi:hypothetical protein